MVLTPALPAFVAKDMDMLEINPLVVTTQGQIKCLDAKMSFDSNALYRHPEIVALRDMTEEDEKEIEASKYDLAYIALDGTIGCMVNGAGLAMATMDIIKLYGVEPGQLPRCRRRRLEGEGDGGVQDHPRRPEREGHSGQHLRRHHAVRRHRRRRHRRGEGGGPDRCRWWCAWKAPTSRGKEIIRHPASTSSRPTISTTPPRRSSPRSRRAKTRRFVTPH